MSEKTTSAKPKLRETIASEIRVAMLRRQVTGAALAAALEKSEAYVSRRLSGTTAFDVDDLEVIADALGVKVTDLVGHAEGGDGTYVSVGKGSLPVTVSGQRAWPDHPVVAGARPIVMPATRHAVRTGR